MKKFRFLSWLLCLSLLFATLTVPGTAALADDAEDKDNNGMKFTKTATANDDGTYTITLEAYATGEKVITDITEDVPTDIILVLDQSGSMDDQIGTVTFEQYKDETNKWGTTYHTRNQDYYEYRHNGGSSNLWHKLEDGSYVSVSVKREQYINYSPYDKSLNYYYYYYRSNLYALVQGEYQKVTVTQDRNTYTYTLPNGTEIASSSGWDSSPTFHGIDGDVLYYATDADDTKNVYTYTYTDANGNEQTIGISTGATTVFSPALYKRVVDTNGGDTKLAAIKSAAETFVNNVTAKAKGADGQIGTADDVNHRIAVVGFASQSNYGNNTELLSISGWNSGSVGVAYNDITDQNLKDVMQSMDTSAGQTMVSNAIGALAANGATRIDLGLDMAERILKANPVSGDEKRNRVVIVFTDGSPTDNNGFQTNIASNAITNSDAIKALGATVYSIGVFSGADATSAGTEPSGDLGQYSSSLTTACNWFMQEVSSNNGTPQSPSYYLSAANAGALNNIFQQISSNIESGSTSVTLDEKSVVKDIVTPYFDIPDGTTGVTLKTADYTAKDTFTNEVDAPETVKAEIKDNTLSVSGFSFKDNWCGEENGNYHGKKLIIEFTVKPKTGFLGGNGVPTNESAGIYENTDAKEPVVSAEVDPVDVKIGDVNIETADGNVYLGASYSTLRAK